MCNVEPVAVVARHDAGCTFTEVDHYRTGNGFTDDFAEWSQGLPVGSGSGLLAVERVGRELPLTIDAHEGH